MYNANAHTIRTFEGRLMNFLSYVYENGGKEFVRQDYSSWWTYQLSGCNTSEEFVRLMKAMVTHGWLTCKIEQGVRTEILYMDVQLTLAGIKKAEEGLPQIPLIGLVNQKITTGDQNVDSKINHARELFFREPQTLENMRSACENLCFVLEPLRKDLKKS